MTAVEDEGAAEAALDDAETATLVAAGGVVGTVLVEVDVTSNVEVTLTVFAKPELDDAGGGVEDVVVATEAGGMTVTASSLFAPSDRQFAASGRGAMTDLSRLRSLPCPSDKKPKVANSVSAFNLI